MLRKDIPVVLASKETTLYWAETLSEQLDVLTVHVSLDTHYRFVHDPGVAEPDRCQTVHEQRAYRKCYTQFSQL